MRILRLDVENFRCIQSLTLYPRPGRNILIGPANSGKTTILEALRLLFAPEYSYLREEAFSRFDVFNLTRSPRMTVKIGATLELTPDQWQHFPELEEPYDPETSSWEAPAEHKSIEAFDQGKIALRIALFYQWDRADPEDRAVAFFPKFDPPGSEECRKITRKHRDVLAFWFAPCNDPVWDTASLSIRSQLSRAARAAGWDPLGAAGIPQFVEQVVRQVEETADGHPGWETLNKLVQDISDRIRAILPSLPPAASMGVTAALTDAWAQRMFEVGMRDSTQQPRIPVSRQGTGTQRAVMIAAQAACAGAGPNGNGATAAGIVAIDEPEVGLHPQAQRALLRSLCEPANGVPPQSFIATHSPAVLQAYGPNDVWVLRNDGKVVPKGLEDEGAPPDAGREQLRKNAERHWQVIAPALFARGAVIVEGATEEGALPEFDKWATKTTGNYRGFDGHDIALVNAGGITNIAGILRVLRWFGVRAVAIHDFDRAGNDEKRDREHGERRRQIHQSADLVLHMPDDDSARDFESMMALGTSPDAMREVLRCWRDNFDPREDTFAQWLLTGLPNELRTNADSSLGASPSDDDVIEYLVGLHQANDAVAHDVREWFAGRCGAGPQPDSQAQCIFRKSTRYGRLWAAACVTAKSVPPGIQDLFRHLLDFVAARCCPPVTGNAMPLKCRQCDVHAENLERGDDSSDPFGSV